MEGVFRNGKLVAKVVPKDSPGAPPLEVEVANRRDDLLWRCVGKGVFDDDAKEFDAHFPGLLEDWQGLMELSRRQQEEAQQRKGEE